MSFVTLLVGLLAGWFVGKGRIDEGIVVFCAGFVACFFQHTIFPPHEK